MDIVAFSREKNSKWPVVTAALLLVWFCHGTTRATGTVWCVGASTEQKAAPACHKVLVLKERHQ